MFDFIAHACLKFEDGSISKPKPIRNVDFWNGVTEIECYPFDIKKGQTVTGVRIISGDWVRDATLKSERYDRDGTYTPTVTIEYTECK